MNIPIDPKYNPFNKENITYTISPGVFVFNEMSKLNPEILDDTGTPDISRVNDWEPLICGSLSEYLNHTLGVEVASGSQGVKVAAYFAVQQYLQYAGRLEFFYLYKDKDGLFDYRREAEIILASAALLLQRPEAQNQKNSPIL